MIIGLTGGIGSGKSAAAQAFADLGVPIIDTDRIAHDLTAPGSPVLQEIAALFGNAILLADGSLDRPGLRRRVFEDPSLRKQLEELLHPRIRERALELINRNTGAPYQILVVPLLFEANGYARLVDRRLVIDCDESLQVARTMQRSGLTELEVRAIMAAQWPRARRLAQADDVILNDGTLEALQAQVREKHEKYINTCTVSQSIS